MTDAADQRLIAALQPGLELVPRPFARLGERAGMGEDVVLARVADWLAEGLIKRFGVVVRHHELGYRANRATFNASFVVYKTEFKNRLQSFSALVPGSTTTENFFQNVGAVEASGAEFSGQWKPDLFDGKIYFNTNISYNISEFQNDIANFVLTPTPAALKIAGRKVPDFPEWIFQGGVTVEPTDGLVFNLSGRLIDDRFTNFINSEHTAGYMIWNAYVDMGDGFGFGPFEQVKARVNVDNIFNTDYLGTIGTTVNTLATFRPGSHRTIQFTLSADF